MDYKVPLLLTPQPEGGYTVTSSLLPELVTEGDSLSEALDNVKDALIAQITYYARLIMQQTRSLRDHWHCLSKARDLLLPRLMSGEV